MSIGKRLQALEALSQTGDIVDVVHIVPMGSSPVPASRISVGGQTYTRAGGEDESEFFDQVQAIAPRQVLLAF